jgi:hypothetical protein
MSATGVMKVETRFLRLRQPVELGDIIDGWRVCWLGGWDKGRIFYVFMVSRVARSRATPRKRACVPREQASAQSEGARRES